MTSLIEHIKEWSTIPNTDPKAKAVDQKNAPQNRKVLVAEIARIRNATIHNENFLLQKDVNQKNKRMDHYAFKWSVFGMGNVQEQHGCT